MGLLLPLYQAVGWLLLAQGRDNLLHCVHLHGMHHLTPSDTEEQGVSDASALGACCFMALGLRGLGPAPLTAVT
jgi:hypothetical protein